MPLEHFPFPCSEPRASARAIFRRTRCCEEQWTRHTKTGNALAAGTKLGPYEILSPIGVGGMELRLSELG